MECIGMEGGIKGWQVGREEKTEEISRKWEWKNRPKPIEIGRTE